MKVKVKDRLARALPAIAYYAEGVAHARFPRRPLGGEEQRAQNEAIGRLGSCQGGNVPARNHQEVHGRPRRDVVKGQHVLFLEQHACRHLPGRNAAKDALIHAH